MKKMQFRTDAEAIVTILTNKAPLRINFILDRHDCAWQKLKKFTEGDLGFIFVKEEPRSLHRE